MVHVLDVRAIARQGVLAPGAVAEALEYPPLLHGLVERECGAPRRLIGLGRDTHRHLHRQPQPDYPTSVPFERAAAVREWMATLRDTEDLVSVGAYVKGTTPRIDQALERRERIQQFLCQPSDTLVGFGDALDALQAI